MCFVFVLVSLPLFGSWIWKTLIDVLYFFLVFEVLLENIVPNKTQHVETAETRKSILFLY